MYAKIRFVGFKLATLRDDASRCVYVKNATAKLGLTDIKPTLQLFDLLQKLVYGLYLEVNPLDYRDCRYTTELCGKSPLEDQIIQSVLQYHTEHLQRTLGLQTELSSGLSSMIRESLEQAGVYFRP